MSTHKHYTGLIERYRDRLPVSASTRIISLNEGNTPLIQLQNIPRLIGKDVDIYVKFEGLNPTGSFKDRGMTMAVTRPWKKAVKPSSALRPVIPPQRQQRMRRAPVSKPSC